jgi:hypothetical protein
MPDKHDLFYLHTIPFFPELLKFNEDESDLLCGFVWHSRGHWANFSTSRPLVEDSETLPGVVSSGGHAGHAELAEEEEDEGEGELPQMSPICPLYDEELPMDAATLKTRQVGLSIEQS